MSDDLISKLKLKQLKVCPCNHRKDEIEESHVLNLIRSLKSGKKIGELFIHKCEKLNDNYGVFDGQHRLESYKRLEWKHSIPCLIFNYNCDEAENHSFRANGGVKITEAQKCKELYKCFVSCNGNLQKAKQKYGEEISDGPAREKICLVEFLLPDLLKKLYENGKLVDRKLNFTNAKKLSKFPKSSQQEIFNEMVKNKNYDPDLDYDKDVTHHYNILQNRIKNEIHKQPILIQKELNKILNENKTQTEDIQKEYNQELEILKDKYRKIESSRIKKLKQDLEELRSNKVLSKEKMNSIIENHDIHLYICEKIQY